MNTYFRTAIRAFAAFALVSCGAASAGAQTITTVQDGDWSSASTWDIRVPDESMGDTAAVSHVVDVTASGANAALLLVGNVAGTAALNITAGDLTVNASAMVGRSGGPGALNLSGGTLSIGGMSLGSTDAGAMTISGGTLSIQSTVTVVAAIGKNGNPATLTIAGGSASITIGDSSNGQFTVGNDGTLVIRPTANGSTGLSSIDVPSNDIVVLDAASTLELDTSSYQPVVGDKWDVITSGGPIIGAFGSLIASGGYIVEEDHSVSGVVTIRVTAAPVPAVSTWGLAAMGLLVLTAGTVALGRRRVVAA